MNNNLEFLRPLGVLRPIFSPIWFVFRGFCGITDKAQQIFGVFILVGMWALLMFNAIARWTDFFTIAWSFEITSFMVAWSICIMMGPITRSNEQIKVTFLPEKLLGEKRGASFLYAIESVIGLILCLYFTYYAYDLVKQTYDLHYTTPSSGGWRYSMWYIRSGLIIGFFFTSIYYLERNVIWIKGLFTSEGNISSAGGTAILTGSQTEKDPLEAKTNVDNQSESEISSGINREIPGEERE